MSTAPSSLRVRLLGGLAVEGLTDGELGSRKARSLVKVLALARGAPVSVPALAEILWSDDPPERPSDHVGVLVSRLRRVLGVGRLTRSDAGFALHADWLDVDELGSLTDEASAALHEGRLAAARAASRAALELARGALLPDDDGEWLEADRARAATIVTRARGIAAAAALRAGDYVAAELSADLVLAHDPYDEAALRIMMQAQVATGRPASALASYARVRQRLADDLGASPSSETEALHTSVVTGVAEPAPSSPRAGVELFGRDRERAALEAQLASSLGRVCVVLLVGEPGIGKSALVQHFVDSLRGRGVRTTVGRADELGRDLPLQPVLDALRDCEPLDTSTANEGWTATMVPDTRSDRARWFGALLGAVTGSAARTVLVIEDVHWADAATIEWLTWAQRRPGALLVIATAQTGTSIAGAYELPIGPLDADAICAIIDGGADAARAAAVYERSGGNPLFALALAGASGDEPPRSVQEVVIGTLARLDPATADVVRAGAVLDAVLDVDLLAGVLHLPATEVIERLERAADVGLLAERGSGFEFRHALVREALGALTGAARSALLHRDAARVLDDRPNRDPLGIAVHARLGGAATIAAHAFEEAAAVSFARSDLAAAEGQLRASIHAVDTAGARAALARVLMVAQRLDEAAVEAERAVALSSEPSSLEIAGWVEYYRRHYERAQRFADEAVARAQPGSPIRASALALGGRIRHGTGDAPGAEERLTAAHRGPPAVRGLVEVWLGQLRVHQGRPTDALDLIEHALIDPEHIPHPFAPLHGRLGRVMALGQLGRVDEAMEACNDFRTAIERAGAVGVRFHAVELNVRSWVMRGMGMFAEAAELNRAAIEHNGAPNGSGPSSEGFAEAYWVACLDLADGQLAMGPPEEAALLLPAFAAMDTWNGTMAWHQRHRLGLLRSRLARAGGDDALAGQLAADVMSDARSRGADRYRALAHVHVTLAGGDGDRVRISQSLDVLRGCAALELPGLLGGLAERFDDDGWRREAAERSAALSSGR